MGVGGSCALSLPEGCTVAPGPGILPHWPLPSQAGLLLEHCCLSGRKVPEQGRGRRGWGCLLLGELQQPLLTESPLGFLFGSDCLAQGGKLGSELGQNLGSRSGHGETLAPHLSSHTSLSTLAGVGRPHPQRDGGSLHTVGVSLGSSTAWARQGALRGCMVGERVTAGWRGEGVSDVSFTHVKKNPTPWRLPPRAGATSAEVGKGPGS